MICPFCSLLCDADDIRTIRCERRTASLALVDMRRRSQTLLPILASEAKATGYQSQLDSARETLQKAKRILVTGRIASVETARAAVTLASKYNATLDCAESGHGFKNWLAIQRVGIHSVSLAEARDHTDLFIVVGNDSMLESVPRMPLALSNQLPTKQSVLLLGEFSEAATMKWKEAGFDTWSVFCDLRRVPNALSQWSRWAEKNQSQTLPSSYASKILFEKLSTAAYTSVVWCSDCLAMEHADLWVERVLQWIAERNETTRCAALPWASLDGTFQQVCTWLTGFPGRVSFRDGIPAYAPQGNSYEQWIDQIPVGQSEDSVVVCIDETVNTTPFLGPTALECIGSNTVIELTGSSAQYPTSIAGFESVAEMFRADQTLLAHVSPTCDQEPHGMPASYWLKGFSA